MTTDQFAILGGLLATLVMFMWSRWRHDMVVLGSLLACVFLGLVPGQEAFSGFGHPAVITVACVLVLGYGLQISGAVDVLAKRVLPASAGPTLNLFAIMTLAAVLSGFMNNVGALALLMPIALQMAAKQNLPPGRMLMPLAFASILGGMVTLIGTPPNLIVSGFRAEAGMGEYAIFDFAPVGLAVAVVGVLFIGLIGWRLVPVRKKDDVGGFETGNHLSEVRIVTGSKAVDKPLREVECRRNGAGRSEGGSGAGGGGGGHGGKAGQELFRRTGDSGTGGGPRRVSGLSLRQRDRIAHPLRHQPAGHFPPRWLSRRARWPCSRSASCRSVRPTRRSTGRWWSCSERCSRSPM